ncbi:ABC transporter ATP-binding protein/permease [Microvirga sp. VF16]|uniref:ABC transporter ATP-binding protein/permease n=1 Tax=Microvirga sp. VF16 TaxID=2807101 RepID=UPI00193D0908|nr:ABC transporter ATP-binding protein/permease [Microvirga sp. VF16]QRM29892.1 ABC transporter ATP-binding protein/permease [Microvirga sp. VF16]
MPDFDPKLGRQLPPPPATGSEQEVGPGQGNTLAKEAANAAAHHPEPPHPHEMAPSIVRELYLLFRDMLRHGKGWPMLRLSAAILVILVCNMVGQVRLNEWNGAFFDAVEKRDTSAFLHQLLVFLVIVVVLLALVVAQTWLQERLKIRLRQRLTQVLLDIWLKPNRAYQLGFMGESSAQPDQRMQEDCRLFSELSTELGVGMLQAFLLLVSFIGVLWALSGPVSFTLSGREITIPGYMVWVAVGYAGIGSGLTWLVGRPMIRLNTLRYAREAELRFALVRVNESSESVALYNGEPDERRNLDEFVEAVLTASRRLSSGLARLTWITSGYGWLAIVVPILAAAPDYFSGRLSFGEMMMVVGAFNQVQSALRYFVDNFPKIADWRSAVLRVATFRQAAIDLEEVAAETRQIEIGPHPKDYLSFEAVSIALSDGSILIEDATAEIQPGERVLIMGESGAGKSTLFRAISGLWPWGSGRIRIPRPEEMMFLPQRPYLPLGTLRAAISYPASPETFNDAQLREALDRCGLGEFVEMLDKHERWDKSLSLGQQQRVAFARLLLHKPRWVFMDEATSALDEENQASMLALFENELKGASVLSIGHRPGLEEFHTRTLHIRKTKEGAILLARPRSRPNGRSQSKLGPKWIGRFRRSLKPARGRA